MNYEDIAAALKEEERLDNELERIIENPSYFDPTHYEDGEGNIKLIPTKKQKHGKDLDALDGAF